MIDHIEASGERIRFIKIPGHANPYGGLQNQKTR